MKVKTKTVRIESSLHARLKAKAARLDEKLEKLVDRLLTDKLRTAK